jgi:hypothetical protein
MNESEPGWRELKSSTHNPNIQEAMASQPAVSEPVPARAQADEAGPQAAEPQEQPSRARKRRR